MLFNSFEFLIFFPVVVTLYFLLPHKYRWFHLLLASCYFYAAFVPAYLLVIFAVVGISYLAALRIETTSGKKRTAWLLSAVALNVLLLCFFKYYYFFLADANTVLRQNGLNAASLPLMLLFPLGLSFQVFQVLAYLFEVNTEQVKAERHFGIFALFVLFFPKLAAGPIERPQTLLFQLREEKYVDLARIVSGLKLMLWGFFKKLVIADRLALYVNDIYAAPDLYGTPGIWLAVLVFFPIQLYCDFSGYSSIAVGAARIMGYDLVDNFRRPFSAVTTSEFWNRWHISLSTWLRDYVYMPVVFYLRRYGKKAVVISLMVTFFVSGVWHGAGWHFVVYGLVQGAVISLEFVAGIKAARLAKNVWSRWGGRILTYFFWALSLVFFRAVDIGQSFYVLEKMFWQLDLSTALPKTIPKLTYFLSFFSMAFLFYFENKHLHRWVNGETNVRREVAMASSLVIVLIAFGVFHNLSFIYQQF